MKQEKTQQPSALMPMADALFIIQEITRDRDLFAHCTNQKRIRQRKPGDRTYAGGLQKRAQISTNTLTTHVQAENRGFPERSKFQVCMFHMAKQYSNHTFANLLHER